MRMFVNDEKNPIKFLDDSLNGKFFYYECEVCHKIKSKRYYKNKTNNFICRECKYQQTVNEKYDGKNPGMMKAKETMLKKYGTTSTSQFIDYSKIDYNKRNEKSKKTLIEKYGVDNPAKSNEIKEKIKKTNLEKYGETVAAKSEVVKQKMRKTLKEKYDGNMPGPLVSHIKFLRQRKVQSDELNIEWLDANTFRGKYDSGPIYYHFKCKKCGNEFEDDFHSGMPICRICNPAFNGISRTEKEIATFIKDNYKGIVVENDREVLNGKELDIYIPKKKLAIEYNGTYWHGYRPDTSISVKQFKKIIEEKRLLCQKLGIRLITIDEADYIERKDVINRFLLDAILPRKRIYARECNIKELTTKEAKQFFNEYHINGYRGGYIKYGLIYDGEIICAAVFGKNKKYENECIRLAYKTGIDVIGGWEKIRKHFNKPFLHYVNLKYFSGENKTGCGYRVWLHKHLYSRQQTQKQKLVKLINNYDDSISDFQNCLNNGAIIIFDLGNDIRLY